MATKKLADAQEGDLARDTRTGIVYQLKNGEWVPLYREGQDISKYLIDRAIAGFVDLPFVPSRIREYFAKRAEQHAPPPGTWAHTAGGVAELAGGLLPFGSAWKWSAKGLTKLPWLRKAVTLPWSQGLPARAAVGAGAGVASDIATRGHKMSPEDIAYSALGGGLFGAIFPSAVGKKKLPPVVSTEGTPPAPTGGASDVQKVEESVAKAMEAVEGKTSGAVPETAPTPTSAPPPSPPAPPPLLEALPSQPWPPRLRYGSAFGNIGPSSETFPYLTRDDTVRLLEQIRRSTGAPIRPRPPVTPPFPPPPFQLPEVPRIRWGEGRGPLTAKEARKATSDLKKQLKGKRAVVIGGVPLLLDEDDIIHYYATQIASPE